MNPPPLGASVGLLAGEQRQRQLEILHGVGRVLELQRAHGKPGVLLRFLQGLARRRESGWCGAGAGRWGRDGRRGRGWSRGRRWSWSRGRGSRRRAGARPRLRMRRRRVRHRRARRIGRVAVWWERRGGRRPRHAGRTTTAAAAVAASTAARGTVRRWSGAGGRRRYHGEEGQQLLDRVIGRRRSVVWRLR